MSTLNPERWRAVSPYLDQALAMPDEERTAWLASLRERNPEVAADLETLLDEHQALVRERFLEQPPVAMHGQAARAGQTIGAYTLVSPIGQGGMGAVWLAERSDGRFQRRAAVKFLNIELLRRGGEERFKREGRILARLTHPHIAHLVDAGVSEAGQPYLVLEHVDGEPIDRYCDHHALDVEARLRLFLDVLAAVAHAHANLIVHRDIKPSNILVGSDGQVKLLDFGIAKLLEDEGQSATPTIITREGGAALNPEYAAPEQITGGPVSTATDVYALGVLLYLLLADDLRRYLRHEPIGARPDTLAYRAAKFARRNRLAVATATLTLAGLSLGLYAANHERYVAQRRFQQVRQLANKVLALDAVIGALPGTTKARHEIVAMSKEYLEALAPEARADQDLALEIGVAYTLLAHAQGVHGSQNLGQYAQADESLRKAEALIEPLLAASPQNRQALRTLAKASKGRMILAQQTSRPNEEALAHARKAVRRLSHLPRPCPAAPPHWSD